MRRLCKKVEFEKVGALKDGQRNSTGHAQKEDAALNVHAEEAQKQLESGVTCAFHYLICVLHY